MSAKHTAPDATPPSSAPAEEFPLVLKRVAIDTWRENVAYLHRDCALYRAEGFQALAKVEVRANGRRILATLNVVDDTGIVGCKEIGLSEDAFAQLGVHDGHAARISQAPLASSIPALRRKIAGERLDRDDFGAIVHDIAGHRYSKIELTAFVVACNQGELDREEVYYLTDAMASVGQRLDWHERPVVDKHCIGGIPGNRTSMLVVPIVAAHGMLCPKTSSRAITSPAGTADTMEVLANVELPMGHLSDLVRAHRGCLAWGGTAALSPADDVLISVERPLSVDSAGQMVASILSKKIAAGSTHLVLDIPVGPTAKVRSMPEAQKLRRLFQYVASQINLTLDVVITDGRQPIGRGIGPVLEARDVMQVLENDPAAPNDLRQKALRLAGRMLEFDPDVRGGDGFAIARDILESGRALAKMDAIIQAQGAKPFDHHAPQVARQHFEVVASAAGTVVGIDNLQIARIARLAGAPKVQGAGVDLCAKLGDVVRSGQPLYRVYADYASDLDFARRASAEDTGYVIGAADAMPHVFVEF
ncbi:thymidine phosphorylase family protein [Nitrogeniibacter mangrovi]|uniref:Putative thymidine phosphorylase n=1 Tax=Nitrogeniibacter mangrovi TaxID=2016596 RepID=A0A6C1B5Z2_9RHOO|nr:thymidine phosphorylase family protein [Nitrogeniibacter mangrovi]QID19132.1 thymidine phosphorylase family protein [Nitrogeniibacter mangrovi]